MVCREAGRGAGTCPPAGPLQPPCRSAPHTPTCGGVRGAVSHCFFTLILMGSGFSREAGGLRGVDDQMCDSSGLGACAEPGIHLKTNESPKPKLPVLSL